VPGWMLGVMYAAFSNQDTTEVDLAHFVVLLHFWFTHFLLKE